MSQSADDQTSASEPPAPPEGQSWYQGPPPGTPPVPTQPYSAPQPYPAHPQYAAPPPYSGQDPYGYAPPTGPPGYCPVGGYSDKTKVAAGLLQLLPGFFLAIGGIGRCYTGHVAAGVIHIVLSVIGWVTAPFLIGLPLVLGSWLWAVIDGIVLLAGQSRDAQGRPLR